jgi:pyruvate-ferredoxin/flavodoxin oxidoreductase
MLVRLTQNDVVYRRPLDPAHRAYVPDFGVFIRIQLGDKLEHRAISRQLVLFCVERRKAWRLLQSKAGIENRDYKAQRSILADVDAGRISRQELFARGEELMRERTEAPLLAGAKAGDAGMTPPPGPSASPPAAAPRPH